MKHNHFKLLLQTLVVLLFVGGIYLFIKPEKQATKTPSSQQASSQKVVKNSKESTGLPKVSPKDWELILVNRDHMTEELSPELVDINGISVDKRIEQATSDFLAAAQAIDPQEHLISGYRSVAYQAELTNLILKKRWLTIQH